MLPAAPPDPEQDQKAQDARRAMMRAMAEANVEEIRSGLAALAFDQAFSVIREPEIGLVMLRGRIGGKGAAFNVGEATVTRAAVKLASGATGVSYLLGRQREKARLAAIVDALWQSPAGRAAVEERILAPIRARWQAENARKAAETLATKVDFFTMVRGED
jgi:alpha-D-ribose 1-methylphosphonate 5-triphosphate synthase subunit PhnG